MSKFDHNDWVKKNDPDMDFAETYGPSKGYVKCSDSHPPLKIGAYMVYGGACANPLKSHGHYDIEISLDYNGSNKFPWDNVIGVHFPITDREAPKEKDAPKFKKMIVWAAQQIKAGKKVHVGCLGGHGRTGLVLSALVATLMPEVEDAIEYVRENYCSKVVETAAQVNFLVKHYKVKKAAAAKHSWGSSSSISSTSTTTTYDPKNRGAGTDISDWVKHFPQPGMNTYEAWKAEEAQKKADKKKSVPSRTAPIEVRPILHKATVLGTAAQVLDIMADPSADWNQ